MTRADSREVPMTQPPALTDEGRCPWSDLPPDQCAHCNGATTPASWPLRPVTPAPPRTHAQQAQAFTRLARVPALRVVPGQTPELADMITELTRTHTQAEPRVMRRDNGETWTAQHRTQVPGLVHQLLGATPGGSGDEHGSATAKSKPAARIEALDTLMLIDDEVSRWLARLGHDVPGDTFEPGTTRALPGSGTIAAIRRLYALHAGLTTCRRNRGTQDSSGAWCCSPHRIVHDVTRWWHQARVISGWDSPAFRPFNTCPICEVRGSLRINLMMRAALCVECRETWTPATIGLLAEHIIGEDNPDEAAVPDEQADTPPAKGA